MSCKSNVKRSVSVGFITLGCAKNLVDAQVMAGYLKKGMITLAPSPESADIILINTCAFIEPAREESAEVILSACAYKSSGGCQAVVVTGCMVQRYRERLSAAFPDVDAFLGIDELEQVGKIVKKIAAGKECGVVVAGGRAHKLYNPVYPTLLFTGGPFAYLKVAEGCDHCCAYCAIPQIRGSFRSRKESDLVAEARSMVRAGVREINLISQDTLQYGVDRGGAAIVSLLRKLDRMEGEFWLRLLYGYPGGVSGELLEFMQESKHLCRYLDLPMQHSHPDMLRAMNRGAAIEGTERMAERLRSELPGVTLRTTCLVGFPGESEAHFEHLLQTVAESRFDHLGVFGFSSEEGTAAYGKPLLPDEVVEERCQRMMALQREIVRENTRALKGEQSEALLLQPHDERYWRARLPRQAPDVDGETLVRGVPDGYGAGSVVPVCITGGRGYNLTAKVTG